MSNIRDRDPDLHQLAQGMSSLREQSSDRLLGTDFPTSSIPRVNVQPRSVVGIASRLVNTRNVVHPLHPLHRLDEHVQYHQPTFNTDTISYRTQLPCFPYNLVNIAHPICRDDSRPIYEFSDGQVSVLQRQFVSTDSRVPRLVEHLFTPEGPSRDVVLPLSVNHHFQSGFGNSSQLPFFFQYPLPHLLNNSFVQSSSQHSKLAAHIPNEHVAGREISSSQYAALHPVPQSIFVTIPEQPVPKRPSSHFPPNTVTPAFDFDDCQGDVAEDICRHSGLVIRQDLPPLKRHALKCDVITDVLPTSDIKQAALEWSKTELMDADGDTEGWMVLGSVKRKRDEREVAFIQSRSVLSQMQCQNKNRKCPEVQNVPSAVLSSVGLVPASPEDVTAQKMSDLPVNAVDVDEDVLRSFAANLLNGDTTIPVLEDEMAAEKLLYTVGLVRKEPIKEENKIFPTSRKRRKAAANKPQLACSLQLPDVGQGGTFDRIHLKRLLDEALGAMSTEYKQLKGKINQVKRLIREEEDCSESYTGVLLAKLNDVLAATV